MRNLKRARTKLHGLLLPLGLGMLLFGFGANRIETAGVAAMEQPVCNLTVGPDESYTTIQSAVDAAVTGQTICVRGGIYHEFVEIMPTQSGLTLVAMPGERPIIDGRKRLPGGTVDDRFKALVEIVAADTVLDGFEVRFSSARGVDISGANVIVRNNSVHDNWSTGINATAGIELPNVLIENNDVYLNMRRSQYAPVIYRGERSGSGSDGWTFDPDIHWDTPFWTGANADLPEQWINGISMTFNDDGHTQRVYAGSARAERVGYIGAEHSKTGQQFSYSGADILFHEPAIDKWTLYLDGDGNSPAIGIPPTGVIDAFQIESTGQVAWPCPTCAPILISFAETVSIPISTGGVVTLTAIEPSDLVRFLPSSLGSFGQITGGTFELYRRASELAGLPLASNLDALDRAPDGRLLISLANTQTLTNPDLSSVIVEREDLVAYDEATGYWSLFFEGDKVLFNPFQAEDLTAAWVDDNGHIYISGDPIGGSALTLINTNDSTARGNRVYNNFGEGLVADRGSNNATLEGNVVFDNQHANIYLNSTTNTYLAGNLVYCTDDRTYWRKGSGPSYKPGPGIMIRDELWLGQEQPLGSGYAIVNNIGIGCSPNFGVSSQREGGGLVDSVVANNTFAHARGDNPVGIENVDLNGDASFDNSLFVNNLLVQAPALGVNLRVRGATDFTTFTVAHNLYSAAPPSQWPNNEIGRIIAADPRLADPDLADSSPPLPGMGVAVDPSDYRLTFASPALDAGQSLAEVPGDFFGRSRVGAGLPDIGFHELPHTATITVVQATSPAGSPQAFQFTADFAPATFNLSDGQQQASGSLQAGTYSITSALVENWETTAVCSDGSPPEAIVLSADENVICTFSSTLETRLTVVNDIVPAGDPRVFDFSLDSGPTFQMGDESRSFVVEPGAHALAAAVPAGWEQSATCDNGDAPGALTLDPGDWVICSFTKTKMGRIVVAKQTDPPNTPGTFHFTATYGDFTLRDGQSHDSGLLSPGATHSVVETPPPGYAISTAICAGDDDGTDPASILLDPGEVVNCTFTNSRTTAGPLATFYITPLQSGTVGGVAYIPGDILAYDNAANVWSLYFDASDVGISRALNDFVLLDNGSILMAFKTREKPRGQSGQIITFEPHDIARFVPSQTGPTTAGYFEPYFDGSDVLLTTSSEKIDALALRPDGALLISTTGAAAVKKNGATLKAQDEDLLVFMPTSLGTTTGGTWALELDGTALAGMAAENLTSVWRDASSGNTYVTVMNNFVIKGVAGTSRTILSVSPAGVVATYWDASAAGFLGAVEGLHIDPVE